MRAYPPTLSLNPSCIKPKNFALWLLYKIKIKRKFEHASEF
ncbi:hypothetical protein JCM19301_2795 [Jejuia pallidilutea]|uniref:Uncharacterized protein n=1 Tax=Jejuia pallidilutea TaxID=504487 RepID=A0A090X0L6_9FLAO|nr:hypothetical protein JCM19301_2795 [Jejuia pallidilutea]GAL73182.1 hypothetical protein JCM19302_3063 [Jejuia pallidilutea]GAL89361.1 hypothetical protein JCM19538_1355 [Jejuia pallidilutea]